MYLVVLVVFSISFFGITKRLLIGSVNTRVYMVLDIRGFFSPYSNTGFRLSSFISGISPIVANIYRVSIITIYSRLIFDMVVIPLFRV